MFDEPTVFVLGAGAGEPYGFPTGTQLNDRIRDWLGHEQSIKQLQSVFPTQEIANARDMAQCLYDTQATVDQWLAQHQEYRTIGKYLVARCVVAAENPSLLPVNWYAHLWNKMVPEQWPAPVDVLLQNKVAFISFNYDRSLEQVLMMKARAMFKKATELECATVISQIQIIHVHGQIGRLPWQDPTGYLTDLRVRPYTYEVNPEDLFHCSGVKIVEETTRETSEFKHAQRFLLEAQRIHFLGFGYHDQNLWRLRCGVGGSERIISGTHHGLSPKRKERLEKDGGEFGMPITLRGMPPMVTEYVRDIV